MNAPKKILLVDDDRHLVMSMAEWLVQQGHQVETQHTFAAAQKSLAARPFDLLITDLRLGDDDGFDLIAATKNQSLIHRFW